MVRTYEERLTFLVRKILSPRSSGVGFFTGGDNRRRSDKGENNNIIRGGDLTEKGRDEYGGSGAGRAPPPPPCRVGWRTEGTLGLSLCYVPPRPPGAPRVLAGRDCQNLGRVYCQNSCQEEHNEAPHSSCIMMTVCLLLCALFPGVVLLFVVPVRMSVIQS